MTDQEILEGNKAVCQFMGGDVIVAWKTPMAEHFSWHGVSAKEFRERVGMPIVREAIAMHILIEHCRFHNNWEWLMPVIEKISRIEYDRQYDEQEERDIVWTHYPVTFGMLNADTGRPMFRFSCSGLFEADTLIEAAYLAVVDFIKWHNEQKLLNQNKNEQ